ncbi:MAG: ArsC/Spx/MgsR family protein [Hyphomicrobiales bacterium]
MTIELYGLKNCDKCRAALKELKAQGKDVSFIDIREDTPSSAVLSEWVASTTPDKILNTRSTTWRGLSEGERSYEGEAGLVKLLSDHPTLIKRPVVKTPNAIHIGWSSKTPI